MFTLTPRWFILNTNTQDIKIPAQIVTLAFPPIGIRLLVLDDLSKVLLPWLCNVGCYIYVLGFSPRWKKGK